MKPSGSLRGFERVSVQKRVTWGVFTSCGRLGLWGSHWRCLLLKGLQQTDCSYDREWLNGLSAELNDRTQNGVRGRHNWRLRAQLKLGKGKRISRRAYGSTQV